MTSSSISYSHKDDLGGLSGQSQYKLCGPVTQLASKPLLTSGSGYEQRSDSLEDAKVISSASDRKLSSNLARELTIEDLMADTGVYEVDLDKKVEAHDVTELASFFDDPEHLLDKVNVSVSPAQRADVISIRGTRAAVTKVLKIWQRANPLRATFRELVIILLSMHRGDVALHICKYLAEKTSKFLSKNNTWSSATSGSLGEESFSSSSYSESDDEFESDSEQADSDEANNHRSLPQTGSKSSSSALMRAGSDSSEHQNLYQLIETKPLLVNRGTQVKSTRDSTQKMQGKFAALTFKITESMKRKNIGVSQLTLFLSHIEALDPVSTTVGDSRLLFQEETLREYKRDCSDIEEVLIKLKGYYSWFNYRLIKSIARTFCDDDEKVTKELNTYRQCLKKYCNKRLRHLPEQCLPVSPTNGTQPCVFKIDEDWNTMKINQLKPIKSTIRRVLRLSKVTLLLRSARNGCVELTFDIPKTVAEVVFPLSEDQCVALQKHRIQYTKREEIDREESMTTTIHEENRSSWTHSLWKSASASAGQNEQMLQASMTTECEDDHSSWTHSSQKSVSGCSSAVAGQKTLSDQFLQASLDGGDMHMYKGTDKLLSQQREAGDATSPLKMLYSDQESGEYLSSMQRKEHPLISDMENSAQGQNAYDSTNITRIERDSTTDKDCSTTTQQSLDLPVVYSFPISLREIDPQEGHASLTIKEESIENGLSVAQVGEEEILPAQSNSPITSEKGSPVTQEKGVREKISADNQQEDDNMLSTASQVPANVTESLIIDTIRRARDFQVLVYGINHYTQRQNEHHIQLLNGIVGKKLSSDDVQWSPSSCFVANGVTVSIHNGCLAEHDITHTNVDLLILFLPVNRDLLYEAYNELIKKITISRGAPVWKNSVVILTGVDTIVSRKANLEFRIKTLLEAWILQIKQAIHMAIGNEDSDISEGILILPAGRHDQLNLPKPHEKWFSQIWLGCFLSSKAHSIPAFLKVGQARITNSSANKRTQQIEYYRQPVFINEMAISAIIKVGLGIGGGGAVIAASASGATIGALIGALAFGLPSFGVAAGVGLVVGGVIGGGAGASIAGAVLGKGYQLIKNKQLGEIDTSNEILFYAKLLSHLPKVSKYLIRWAQKQVTCKIVVTGIDSEGVSVVAAALTGKVPKKSGSGLYWQQIDRKKANLIVYDFQAIQGTLAINQKSSDLIKFQRNKNSSLLVFCIPMTLLKEEFASPQQVRYLKSLYEADSNIFSNIVIVLTNANELRAERNRHKELTFQQFFSNKLDEWKRLIQTVLIRNVCIDRDTAEKIPIIPVSNVDFSIDLSNNESTSPSPATQYHWLSELLLQAMPLTKPEGLPTLIKINRKRVHEQPSEYAW